MSAAPRCRSCGRRVFPQKSGAAWRDRNAGRRLCTSCYDRSLRRGTLLNFPMQRRSRDDLLDDWLILRDEGHTLQQAAERLGMSWPTFERAFYRARAAGDPRALYPLGRLRGVA